VDLTTGLLGHLSFSRRYKEDIKPMNNASETLYQLRPVCYRYKKEIDSTQSPAFGLIAEEVAEVNPDLVARNAEEQPESVHYEMVNAMLLNEFLKEHKAFLEEQSKVQKLEAALEAIKARLKEQDAKIEKVSAQLKINKQAPTVVQNNQ
jgi:predicted ribosome quality control (RQC) complex YloA/Tae2 family protein